MLTLRMKNNSCSIFHSDTEALDRTFVQYSVHAHLICASLLDSHAYILNAHSCNVISTAPVKLPPDKASICLLSGIFISGKLIELEHDLHTTALSCKAHLMASRGCKYVHETWGFCITTLVRRMHAMNGFTIAESRLKAFNAYMCTDRTYSLRRTADRK